MALVSIIVRRQRKVMFLDVLDDMSIENLKSMISDHVKIEPAHILLRLEDSRLLEDKKTLAELDINDDTSPMYDPLVILMAFRKEDGTFEDFEDIPYKVPDKKESIVPSYNNNSTPFINPVAEKVVTFTRKKKLDEESDDSIEQALKKLKTN